MLLFGRISSAMGTQKFLNNPDAGKWALKVSQWLPPRMGIWIVKWVSKWIASQPNLSLVQAIRCNQWVAGGERASSADLDLQVKRVLHHAGISYYNLFHHLYNAEKLQKLVVFTPEIEEIIHRSQEKRQGLIVAGIHLSNFDLVAQAAALHGLKALALSLPEPDQAIQWQHELRRQSGLEILDATLPNLRSAILRLKAGETVVTGLDRPIPEPKIMPVFFGRPAHLAVHHVQLAIHAKVPVVVMGAIMEADERYHIHSSGEIQMKSYLDRHTELRNNAEQILEITQDIISQALDQWVVFQPIWPEAAGFVPDKK